MLVFAGIHEITKELDDMALYNFKTQKWDHLFSAYIEKKPMLSLEEKPSKMGNQNHSAIRGHASTKSPLKTEKSPLTATQKGPVIKQ